MMYFNVINPKINRYLKYKYNITPLDEDEKKLIMTSKTDLNNYFDGDKVSKVKESFCLTIEGIKKILIPYKDNSIAQLYLGSIFRDLYFCFGNGISVNCMVQIDEKAGVKTNILSNELNSFHNNISDKKLVTDIIDELENLKHKITNNI